MAHRKNSVVLQLKPDSIISNPSQSQKASPPLIKCPQNIQSPPLGVSLFANLNSSWGRSAISQAPSRHPLSDDRERGNPEQGKEGECEKCRQWREWAHGCEKAMLLLEKELIGKMEIATKQVQSLEEKLAVAVNQKQRYMDGFKQAQVALHTESSKLGNLSQKVKEAEKQLEKSRPDPEEQQTPTRPKNMGHGQNWETAKVMGFSQQLSENQPVGKASTIATKIAPESLFNTMAKDISGEWDAAKGDRVLEKCLFENQILKDYNTTLLHRLRESKFRR